MLPSAPAPAALRTPRLLLRRWREADRDAFAAMNGDPEVMRYFPAPLTRLQSDALLNRIAAEFSEHGVGLWAVQRVHVAAGEELLGFVGLSVARELPFAPAVEVGWRLGTPAWGQGYATESAAAAIADARRRGVGEVVSFTAAANLPSQRVMQRLGMRRDPAGDFDHPRVTPGSPLRRHVLYRLPGDQPPRGVS